MGDSKAALHRVANGRSFMNPEENLSEQMQDVADTAIQEVQEDPQERNWREVNKTLKEQKAALDRVLREKEELMYELQKRAQEPVAEEEDEELDIYSPDFSKGLVRKIKKAVHETYNEVESRRKNDPAYLEEQARKKYSDFDSVVTSEHIESIIKSNPLVHKAIMNSGAPLEAAYEFIKSSAAFQSQKSANSVTQKLMQDERKKLAEHQQKPKAAAAMPRSNAMSAVTGFRRLTAEQAAEINRETTRIIRGR